MIYPDSFEQKTGFTEIRRWIAELCVCQSGIQKVEDMAFSSQEEMILHRVGLTEEFRQILLMENTFPTLDYKDLTVFLKRIRIEGTWIDAEELAAFRLSLETLRSVLGFLANRDESLYPLLKSMAGEVRYYPFLLQRVDSILDKFGRIRDNASPALASIRRERNEKLSAVSKVMQKVLKLAQAEGWTEAEATPAVRDGRTVIPVTAAYKRKIQGIVHDESATGKTSYIEPAEVVETNNQIRELELAERREIIKILTQLTDEIRPYLPEILASCDFLGSLDFIRAKALLALKMNAVKPFCLNRSPMRWIRATHPLMYISHAREGREVVPLDISMDEKQRILLISGPNAGGKSVCLKTLGLVQYMFQCGMLVPMSENSEMGIFDHIFMDIGDEQSIENDLSTYSSHLMNMKYFLRHADSRTLILIDEFGTGTEPALGGAIAESVLDHLNRKEVYGVITTHYTNLKHFAASTEGIANGAMLYDTHRMLPLFRLEIGMPGSSFAFEIARKIGLPEEILTQASDRIGKDHIDFDKHLRDIVRDKRYWESKREKIRQSEKRLEEELSKHALELDRIDKERRTILEQAKTEARNLLSGVNRQIETTIREIRESQAEKEKTREVRKSLEILREEVERPATEDESGIAARMEKLKARQNRIKTTKTPVSPVKTLPEPREAPLSVKDKVRIEGQQVAGEILEIQGKNASVAFGNLRMTVPLKKLLRVSQNEYKQYLQEVKTLTRSQVQVYDLRERRLQFKSSIDLRGQKTEDALRKVQEFIDEALMLGYDEVKILHGKGNGILRQMIREFLNASGLVKSFADEQEEFGGAGITVVSL